jgi:glutamine synthetase
MAVYGDGNALRMTGECETASMDSFTFSVGGRHTSIRIPAAVAAEGCGYFEDRRPAANVDPYRAFSVLLDTVCGGTESA